MKGIGLLGNLVHIDLSVKDPYCFIRINSFIVLMTFAIGLFVIHQGVMIDMLLVFYNGDSFHGRVNMFSFLIEVQIVSRQFSAKRESVYFNLTAALLFDIGVIYKRRIVTVILYFIIIYNGVFIGKDFCNSIRPYRVFC